jgi:hypothetical protein
MNAYTSLRGEDFKEGNDKCESIKFAHSVVDIDLYACTHRIDIHIIQ